MPLGCPKDNLSLLLDVIIQQVPRADDNIRLRARGCRVVGVQNFEPLQPFLKENLTIKLQGLILTLSINMRNVLHKLWSGIKAFSKKVAHVQAIIILTLFYFIVIGLFSLIIRLLGKDLLNKKWKDKKESYWVKKEKVEVNLENARRQF